MDAKDVHQVNLTSTLGDMGILADHVPTIAQLRPGVIEIFVAAGDKPQKYFVSGGYAVMNPDSTLSVNAVEANTLEELDVNVARKAIDESTKKLAVSGLTDAAKAAIKIEMEVYEAVVAAKK